MLLGELVSLLLCTCVVCGAGLFKAMLGVCAGKRGRCLGVKPECGGGDLDTIYFYSRALVPCPRSCPTHARALAPCTCL